MGKVEKRGVFAGTYGEQAEAAVAALLLGVELTIYASGAPSGQCCLCCSRALRRTTRAYNVGIRQTELQSAQRLGPGVAQVESSLTRFELAMTV